MTGKLGDRGNDLRGFGFGHSPACGVPGRAGTKSGFVQAKGQEPPGVLSQDSLEGNEEQSQAGGKKELSIPQLIRREKKGRKRVEV